MGKTSYLCEKCLLTDSCTKGNGLSYAHWCSQVLAMYIIYMCASPRFRERWIVPIDVPCIWHLSVHVWVRHNEVCIYGSEEISSGNIKVWQKNEVLTGFFILLTHEGSSRKVYKEFKLMGGLINPVPGADNTEQVFQIPVGLPSLERGRRVKKGIPTHLWNLPQVVPRVV